MRPPRFIYDRGDNLPNVPLVRFENIRKSETLVICLRNCRPFDLKPGQCAKVPVNDLAAEPELDVLFESLEPQGFLRRHVRLVRLAQASRYSPVSVLLLGPSTMKESHACKRFSLQHSVF